MTTFQTAELTPTSSFHAGEALQVYCGLDCCLTIEVLEAIKPQLADRPQAAGIYSFERALQAPYLEIMQRGFRIDEGARRQAAYAVRVRIAKLQNILNQLAGAAWGRGLNPRSPSQLAEFFYKACRLPEVFISQKGIRRVSTNREALEKLDQYLHVRPIISCILTIRDLGKQLDVFESEIDSDYRFRTSYNIAGTETGRASSSTSSLGTGGNAQNIAPGLRHVFVADPHYKLCVIDLEQVEARDVGWFEGCLFDDWKFLDACEGGDLHTINATRIWPELGWTGDPVGDRRIADGEFYRGFTYRDMAKRGSHLSNYSGSAWTMARSLKIPLPLAEEFQQRYCRGPTAAYPAHQRWWEWTRQQLQTTRHLTTPFGRQRYFFGRPDDDTTLREAIAFLPQSTTADRTNLGLWRAWHREPNIQLLAQTHDSITFQLREDSSFDDTIGRVLEHIKVELRHPSGRRYVVPGEAKVGWNWGYYDPKRPNVNPEGLTKWKPGEDTRNRKVGLQRLLVG